MAIIKHIEKTSNGTTITKEPTWIDRLLCKIFGHIKMPDSNYIYFSTREDVKIPSNATMYCIKFIPCKRCYFYPKHYKEEYIPLTEDELMIKNIIE